MRIPLTGGAYAAKSVIADAQRCINLYPEQNPQDAPAPTTHYQTPGLTLIGTPPVEGEFRGLHTASNGTLFAVVGNYLYTISGGKFTLLQPIGSNSGPVSMVDNGLQMVLVDGTIAGYSIDLETNVVTTITDPAFYGADAVQFVDTFFIFNRPDTQQFYISGSNAITFDPLDIAAKSTYPDNLVTLAVMHRELWLFGELTTEVWYNTGASDFTFGRMPGVFIEHGCAAKHSVAKIDLALFWLGQDLQGKGIVFAGKNYSAERISTHALEQELRAYSRIDDAIGFSYMQEGHAFYVLTFPTANKTWCFDVATGQWAERGYMEADGTISRHRMNCHAVSNGANLVGDWETGLLYELDPKAYTDNGNPILRLRSFPHIGGADGNRVMFRQFIADMEVGDGLPGDTADPEVRLRWSDDRGRSWGNPVVGTLGKVGEYLTSIQWQRLGYARDRVFELSWSAPVKTALNGAWVDASRART